jgi:hypothetical protein
MAGIRRLVIPDGRYFVVKGKLWRLSDPGIEPGKRARLVRTLMDARRAVKNAECAGTAMRRCKLTDGSRSEARPWRARPPCGGTTVRPISTDTP